MSCEIRVTLLAILMMPFHVGAAAQATQTAAVVYQQSLEALGGKAGLQAIHSLRLTGEGMAFRFAATFDIQADFPDRIRLAADTAVYQYIGAFDGAIGWEKQSWTGMHPPTEPHVRQLGDSVLERLKYNVNFLPYQRVLDVAPTMAGTTEWKKSNVYVLNFTPADGPAEEYYIDTMTYLPVARRYSGSYVEGGTTVTTEYGDYREIGSLNLPHSIHFPEPDLPRVHFEIKSIRYELNAKIQDTQFTYPNAQSLQEKYEVALRTLPYGVYKESDWQSAYSPGWEQNPRWGVTFGPTETWTFDLMASEKHGRWLSAVGATVDLYAGDRKIKTIQFSKEAILMLRRDNVSRLSGMSSNHVFRHHFTEPTDLHIDRMSYRLVLEDPAGKQLTTSREIPVEYYQQKTRLIFPIKGAFIDLTGHAYSDIGHKDEWTQWFAMDIFPLSPKFHGLHTGIDEINKNFYGYHLEVIAPAAGVVAYARNDISDLSPANLLSSGIADPVEAIGGNIVIIDHGNGESSFFGHFSQGSVRVKKGDKVEQGQIIGLLGASNVPGVPHLHYHLQGSPYFPRGDGLPAEFENLETLTYYPGFKVTTVLRGYPLVAK
jgi:murein DD-endopeptidase MepM/ murein hydrolase activator NlpD